MICNRISNQTGKILEFASEFKFLLLLCNFHFDVRLPFVAANFPFRYHNECDLNRFPIALTFRPTPCLTVSCLDWPLSFAPVLFHFFFILIPYLDSYLIIYLNVCIKMTIIVVVVIIVVVAVVY